ncbi:LOW QUALITY PROTEIN: eukaryotic translation initiation factor 3 subunit L-like [Rhopilema esculentum]|uniref:LOW QUALITY PROTEIN: eukaryotic translation initiation factor 3 subunit L-like n=1 Tax=Rhopilema esculentum TaxID=499914 RepID=UPI0031DB1CC2
MHTDNDDGRLEKKHQQKLLPQKTHPSANQEYGQMMYNPGFMQEMGYPPEGDVQSYIMPPEVKTFLVYFRKQIMDQNVYEIQSAYDISFNGLTEIYFQKSPWPDPKYIAPLCRNDEMFIILYKELYYRHIYAKLSPSLEHRKDSYYNYCQLFNYILNESEPVPLALPNQWLWDIIDEFIYQFQSFTHYKAKVAKMPEEDKMSLKEDQNKIWNVHSVLNVLYSLVEISRINEQLEVYAADGDPDTVAGDFGKLPLYKMFGYFSLIGLLRLHSLLGDYYQAIKVLGNVDLHKKTLYSRVPACQVTTYYYVGFAYMMMRRYQDAIRSFTNILLYIQRAKSLTQSKSYQFDQMMKNNEKMHNLLLICLVLCPQRIDESIHQQLREKFGDKMNKMQKGDKQCFEECFSFSCPKFVSPVPTNYDAPPTNTHLVTFNLQLKMFKNEIEQQIDIPVIRSFLKLYTTMPISKLAAFLEVDEETLRTKLLCYKHKQRNMVWTKGTDALEGEFQSSSEVDFYIDQDMIHIADTKVARRYGDFFIRHIGKIEDLNLNVKALGSTKA